MNVNPTDIVDGKPHILLGLLWKIILYWQIESQEELILNALRTAGLKKEDLDQYKGNPRKTLLSWVGDTLKAYSFYTLSI